MTAPELNVLKHRGLTLTYAQPHHMKKENNQTKPNQTKPNQTKPVALHRTRVGAGLSRQPPGPVLLARVCILQVVPVARCSKVVRFGSDFVQGP